MGCSACMKKKDEMQNEMINGSLPEDNINKEKEIISKNNNDKNNILRQNTVNTDNLEADQERGDDVFDFFNKLRQNPKNYLEEAKNHDVGDLIESAEKYVKNQNVNFLIKNPFFNLFLDMYVKKTPYSKEEILNGIESNNQLINYNKFLYSSEAPIDKPKECIWNLLKNNKDIALKEILYKKSDYFLVSTISISETKKIISYFLFLKKTI